MSNVERLGSVFKDWLDTELNSEEKSHLVLRWGCAFLMTGAILSGLFFGFRILSVNVFKDTPVLPRPSLADDRVQTETTVKLYRAIMEQRKDSQRIANDIIRIGRNPMAKMESPKDIPLLSPEPSIPDLADLPPIVIVRAVMIMDGGASAVVDIDGLGYGIVVKKGTSFLGGKGRIVSIKAREVVFRWNGKNIPVPVNL